MTKNRTRTPVYLDPGMHPGLEVKGLSCERQSVHSLAALRHLSGLPHTHKSIYHRLLNAGTAS